VFGPVLADILSFSGGTLKSGSAAGITVESTSQTTTTNHTATVQAGGAILDTSIGNITSTALFNGGLAGTITVKGGHTFTSNVTNNGLLSIQDNSVWDIGSTGGATAVFTNSSVAGLSGNGSVVNSSATAGTLTVNIGSGSQTYSGAIGGGANLSLIKSGAGTQVLSGSSTFTGTTSVNAGLLAVTGSMTGSAVTINTGGVLGGNGNGSTTGAYGNVAIATGGLLQPGTVNADGSIGTVTMANLDATNGGTGSTGGVRFDLVSPGASDMINVTGTATFSSSNSFTAAMAQIKRRESTRTTGANVSL